MIWKFELTYSGTTTEVSEPEGFTDFSSELKRDFNEGGVFYNYVSGDLKLGFADGRSILEAAYQADGIDAIVTLKISKAKDKYNAYFIQYEGRAIFENREIGIDYFSIDFEQIDFLEKIKNRIDINIALDKSEDLDGNAITPPTPTEMPFHSKGIQKKSIFEPSALAATNSPSLTGPLLFAPYDDATSDDLGEIKEFDSGGIYLPSGVATGFTSQIELTDTAPVVVNYNFPLRVQITSGTESGSKTLAYDLYIGHYESDGTTLINTYNVETGTQAVTVNSGFDVQFTLSGSQSFSADKGTFVRLYYNFSAGGIDALLILVRNSPYNWDISQITTYPVTNVNVYTYHEAFKHVLNAISGADFHSDYLGLTEYGYASDGCAGLNGVTGGYLLRGVDTKPEVTFKQLLTDVRLRWGLGWGVENTGYGYRVRVEPIEHFYQDVEIVDFSDQVIDYVETVVDDIPNEVVLGYRKYATQERFNAIIDDHCTQVQFSTPIIKKKKKLEIKTDIISSPYLIEFTRRVGSIEEGWKYDEDLFHVDLVRDVTYTFIPRKTEDFTGITGLIDSATTYNLHHHPVYFLFNQGMYLNSWMFGKAITEKYRNTFFAVNKNLAARYTGGCPHLEPLEEVATSGDFEISKVNEGLGLFNTSTISFKIALTNAQFTEIIDSHENNGISNYGYFQFLDKDGNTKQGYLLSVSWNPVNEIGEFKLIERNQLFIPDDPSDYDLLYGDVPTCGVSAATFGGEYTYTDDILGFGYSDLITITDSGSSMFVSHNGFGKIYQFILSIPYDITTATVGNSIDVTGEVQDTQGIAFEPDGLTMYVLDNATGSTGKIHKYTGTKAFLIATFTHDSSVTLSSEITIPEGFYFDGSGRLFIVDTFDDKVNEFSMTSPYDITSLSFVKDQTLTGKTNPNSVHLSTDGDYMFILNSAGQEAVQYELSTPFDINTLSEISSYDYSGNLSSVLGMDFNQLRNRMYLIDIQDVVQFNIEC